MSGDFVAQLKGFTPLMDALVEELGLVAAAVYGAVWRYCQMEDGVCRASLETVAGRVRVDRRTALRHVKALVAAGYLRDLTPQERARPHRYSDTGKARLLGLVEARTGPPAGSEPAQAAEDRGARSDTESPPPPNGPGQRGDRESLPGVTESHSRSDRESLPGVTESHSKRLSKIEGKTPSEDTLSAGAAPAGGEGHRARDDLVAQEVLDELSAYFCQLTGLAPPPGPLRELEARWRRPLQELAVLCEWEERTARELVRKAVAKLRASDCVIADPRSILRTAVAMAGRVRAERDPRRFLRGYEHLVGPGRRGRDA